MLLKVKPLKLVASKPIAIISKEVAKKLFLHPGQRIRIKKGKKEIVAIVDIAREIVKNDEIAVSQEIVKELKLKQKSFVDVYAALKPLSITYIAKKLSGKKLSFMEIYSIISSIVKNKLTEPEIAYFVSATYTRGMDLNEIVSLIKAMVKTGKRIKQKSKLVIDKHSIGGVAGNRTTPIVVPIIAKFCEKFMIDAVIPKTSSRAISSAAGTADVIETLARVEFSIEEIEKILSKTRACLVWGGTLGLAPADDKIIEVEKMLNLDPEPQLIASILSKKLAVNATHVIIDIPYGSSAKVRNLKEAKALSRKFETIAKQFKLKLKCIVSDGTQPIGNGIGPKLEALDVLAVLKQERKRPLDLEKKSLFLASHLISFISKMPLQKAFSKAREILRSKEAFEKFKEIIEAQQGSVSKIKKKLKVGKHKLDVKSEKDGKVVEIDNRKISYIARLAGCPVDKGSGIFLYKHLNEKVKKGEKLFSIFAESKEKLEYAKLIAGRIVPVKVK